MLGIKVHEVRDRMDNGYFAIQMKIIRNTNLMEGLGTLITVA